MPSDYVELATPSYHLVIHRSRSPPTARRSPESGALSVVCSELVRHTLGRDSGIVNQQTADRCLASRSTQASGRQARRRSGRAVADAGVHRLANLLAWNKAAVMRSRLFARWRFPRATPNRLRCRRARARARSRSDSCRSSAERALCYWPETRRSFRTFASRRCTVARNPSGSNGFSNRSQFGSIPSW